MWVSGIEIRLQKNLIPLHSAWSQLFSTPSSQCTLHLHSFSLSRFKWATWGLSQWLYGLRGVVNEECWWYWNWVIPSKKSLKFFIPIWKLHKLGHIHYTFWTSSNETCSCLQLDGIQNIVSLVVNLPNTGFKA